MSSPSSKAPIVRVGIMGAGAIGCYLGGCLAANGTDVVLVGRERLVKELEASGLTVEGLDGVPTRKAPRERYEVSVDPAALASCDVVLVCVKSAQTAEAAALLAPVLPRGTIVVSMQNGVRNADVLREHLPPESVRGGIFGFNVVTKDNGVFRQATTAPIVIEQRPAGDDMLRTLAERIRAAGLPTELTSDIRPQQWTKLLINLNNSISALSDRPTKELVFGEGYRKILAALISEGLGILRRTKTPTAKLGALPIQLFPFVLRLPAPLLKRVLAAQLKVDSEARSSMWQDLVRGRKTEVDYLNGEIVALAKKNGLRAPLNENVVSLMHIVEQRGQGSPKLGPEALWDSIKR